MPRVTAYLSRYRFLAAALAASVALHAALFVSLPPPPNPVDVVAQPFSAELLPPPPAPAPVEAKPHAAPPRPAAPKEVRRPPRPAARHAVVKASPPAPAPKLLAALAPSADLPAVAPPAPQAPPPPPPEAVALAEPIIPWMPDMPPVAPQPALFPMDALPKRLSIDYRLSTGPLTAHAVYRWRRKGDTYRITGEGEATGLFRIFMDGAILQESEGTITSAGLRPERFLEKRTGADDEGLDFDWLKHEVTLEHGDAHKTMALSDDTVDWLTMIFQLAHVPPRADGEMLHLRVFTQRKLYDFALKVVGIEDIDIPLGKVRALHLRHVDPKDGDVIDVWLGIDQHYLPVKMRYPVAKMKFVVEQDAARISER